MKTHGGTRIPERILSAKPLGAAAEGEGNELSGDGEQGACGTALWGLRGIYASERPAERGNPGQKESGKKADSRRGQKASPAPLLPQAFREGREEGAVASGTGGAVGGCGQPWAAGPHGLELLPPSLR